VAELACKKVYTRSDRPFDCGGHNRKLVIDGQAGPTYAELHIVERLVADGWEAVWVDNWPTTFRTSLPRGVGPPGEEGAGDQANLPPTTGDVLEQMRNEKARILGERRASWGSCWDVLAWRPEEPTHILFVEVKGARGQAAVHAEGMGCRGVIGWSLGGRLRAGQLGPGGATDLRHPLE
jgi:hypothetical protein